MKIHFLYFHSISLIIILRSFKSKLTWVLSVFKWSFSYNLDIYRRREKNERWPSAPSLYLKWISFFLFSLTGAKVFKSPWSQFKCHFLTLFSLSSLQAMLVAYLVYSSIAPHVFPQFSFMHTFCFNVFYPHWTMNCWR